MVIICIIEVESKALLGTLWSLLFALLKLNAKYFFFGRILYSETLEERPLQ